MAVITASATGGNWNATGTWVGGVVPVNGDYVVLASTSGNVIVNVGTNQIIGLDATNYTGTLSGALSITFGGGSTASVILSSAMTYTHTGNLTFGGTLTAVSMRTNGKVVRVSPPTNAACVLTLLDTLNVSSFTNTTSRFRATGADIIHTGSSFEANILTLDAPYKYYCRGTGSVTLTNNFSGNTWYVIDTTATLATGAGGIIFGGSGSTVEFTKTPASFTGTSGTLNGKPNVGLSTALSAGLTNSLINSAGVQFGVIVLGVQNPPARTNHVLKNIVADEVYVTPSAFVGPYILTIFNNDYFTASNFNIDPTRQSNLSSVVSSVAFGGTGTYSIGKLNVLGTNLLQSNGTSNIVNIYGTPSVAKFNLTDNCTFAYCNITDIYNYGTPQVALGITLSNTIGFLNSINSSSTFAM